MRKTTAKVERGNTDNDYDYIRKIPGAVSSGFKVNLKLYIFVNWRPLWWRYVVAENVQKN